MFKFKYLSLDISFIFLIWLANYLTGFNKTTTAGTKDPVNAGKTVNVCSVLTHIVHINVDML